jgi:hypothetical protein
MIVPSLLSTISSTIGLGQIRPAEALRPLDRIAAPPAPPAAQRTSPSATDNSPSPARIPPRGSLLDLTV